jgi:hypothetical protein
MAEERREDKGKEKLGESDEYEADGEFHRGYDDHVVTKQTAAPARLPEVESPSTMPEGKSLKESFHALDNLLERRKPRFQDDENGEDDLKGKRFVFTSCPLLCAIDED